MSKHTPGPLFVSVENSWPFNIVTKNTNGEIVFTQQMPCHSTSHKSAQEAITGKGIDPAWDAENRNRQAIADEVLRAAAPDLLEVLKMYSLSIDTNNIALSCIEFGSEAVEKELKRRAAIAKATGAA